MKESKTKKVSEEESIQQESLEATQSIPQLVINNRELMIKLLEFLELLNQPSVSIDVIHEIVGFVKKSIGIESVAIRLRNDDDFPYAVADGLPDSFIRAENSVCSRNHRGEILRDPHGNPIFECVCGEVIRGGFDPSSPFVTKKGSFWTNNRSKLLNSVHGNEIAALARDRFLSHGYESVAIIPLRSGKETVGLLQFNDTRENCLSLKIVRFLEAIGSILGIALARIRAAEELNRTKSEFEHRLVERMNELRAARQLAERQAREREEVEQQLSMSRQRLEFAMGAANLGSWDWNVYTDEVYFDQRSSKMFGYSSDETRFGIWQNRIHREDKLKVLKTLKRHLENPSHYFEAEYRLQAKSEEWRWILDRGSVVEMDEQGKPKRMAGVYLDITDRKQMEYDLHETSERFRGIFESARDCIFVKDSSLRYTNVNPSFVNMIGLPEGDIVGWTDADLYDRDSAEILQEVDGRVLNGESTEQEHTRVIRGIPRTFLDTKVPMRDSRGSIVGVVGISREITDRKHIESVPSIQDSDYRSAAMRETLRSAHLAAETDTIVMLTGESGAGKDHIARHIHDQSRRANGPFFSINCAAVSPELAESELFGYESGAFTGAKGLKRGLLELAEGGTILLNEIGELSLPLQAKLLTFLDTRQFTRVGGVRLFTVNARLIAATNRNLEKEAQSGSFRQDLFYRLNVFSIEVPPLRQRAEDIPLLVNNIVAELSFRLGLDSIPIVDPKALTALADYSWPGNVRELRNVLERALILCDKRKINVGDLALSYRSRSKDAKQGWSVTVAFPEKETINDVTMNLKKALVMEALRRTRGSRKRAAELLGISPDSLKHYMQIFDLYAVVPFQAQPTV